MNERVCVECGNELTGHHIIQKYCSSKCKARWRKKLGFKQGKAHIPVTSHFCRVCNTEFPIRPDQGNKWLCSPECRRKRNAESVRTFNSRRPEIQKIYRARTKAKMPPDSQNRRFYMLNPDAPKFCQSCAETRVLEIAHKPGHERFGERRNNGNQKWPEKVWVLCPTCHRLLDRMHYDPVEDLNLTL